MNNACVDSLSLSDFNFWQKVKARRIPFSFDLELTARCNNNCRHCYINLPQDDRAALKSEISFEQITAIADAAVSLGALWCLLTGGEPLLREDFSDIYLYLKKKGLLVSIFTNAALVTEEHVRLFKRFPPRDMEVSVYGSTPKVYEAVTRVPGSFRSFRQGLDLLHKSGLKVRLKAMALRSNCGQLDQIRRFCRRHSNDYFRFDPFLHLRYDHNSARNREIVSERLSAEEITRLEQSDPDRLRALQRDCLRSIDAEPVHPSGAAPIFQCGAGVRSFAVTHDGRFQLCPSLRHPDCSVDLQSETLECAWRNRAPRIRRMLSENNTFRKRCRSCALINLCQWCPANAFLETGALDEPVDYFCTVAHARARTAMAGFVPKSGHL